jgi:ribokinase
VKVVVVVGSINSDLVCRTPRFPRPGETIIGGDFHSFPGGKGANQAVAAARLGATVHMVARVGDDVYGPQLIAALRDNRVNIKHVRKTPGVASGCGVILINHRGENSIVVAPGANAHLSPADVDAAEGVIENASAVLLQLEIPLATVLHTIALCRRLGVPAVLDPAPVPPRPLPRAIYDVDVLTPNEHEAAQLSQTLLAKRCARVVLKLGKRGSLMRTRDGPSVRAASFPVKVVDTTAAGDAFTAALAVAMAEGRTWDNVLRFANAAGALCCTKLGAIPSLPTRAEVNALIAADRRGSATPPRRAARGSPRRWSGE